MLTVFNSAPAAAPATASTQHTLRSRFILFSLLFPTVVRAVKKARKHERPKARIREDPDWVSVFFRVFVLSCFRDLFLGHLPPSTSFSSFSSRSRASGVSSGLILPSS